MATVTKREWTSPAGEAKSAWIVRYQDQDGKQRLKTFKAKKPADAYRIKVEGEVQRGVHVPDRESDTVAAIVALFVEHLEHRRKRGEIGETYLRHFRGICRNYVIPGLGKLRFNRLRFVDVERWHVSMLGSLSARMASDYLASFKLVEDYARKRGFTSLGTVADVLKDVGGVARPKIRTFTQDQVRALLAETARRPRGFTQHSVDVLRCVTHLAAFSGLRFGEIVALTLDHVDLDRNVVRVRHSMTMFGEMKGPKTRAGLRDVPMPKAVSAMLRAYLRDHHRANERNLLFTTKPGKRITPGVFHRWYWRPLLTRVGIGEFDADGRGYHFHALRHFAASMMVDRGVSAADVAGILGHSSFDMTLRVYTHSVTEAPQQHAAIETISSAFLQNGTTSSRHGENVLENV